MAGVAISTRVLRTPINPPQTPAQRRTSYSQDMVQEMASRFSKVRNPQLQQTALSVEQQLISWGNNHNMNKMHESVVAPIAFSPENGAFATSTTQQSPHQQDGFLMPDLWKTGLTPRTGFTPSTGLTPRTGLTPYGFNGKEAGGFDQAIWDYFSLDHTHNEQIVAPQDLASTNTSTSTPNTQQTTQVHHGTQSTQQVSSNPDVKIPKKRGRKRKQLDEKTRVEERKKFLERNRVAANRCRERKKTYVSSLETRQKEVLAKNQYLHVEVEALREEIAILKHLVHVDCACSELTLEQNLRRKLGDTKQPQHDIEAVVAKFKCMRASGDTSGTVMDAQMKEMAAASPSSHTDESSIHDELLSVVGEDSGRTSADLPTLEDADVAKSVYLPL